MTRCDPQAKFCIGGTIFKLVDDYFYCFAEDIRHTDIKLVEEKARTSARRAAATPNSDDARWALHCEDQSIILARMPIEEDEVLRGSMN
jgi:hypothetical protein